MSDLVTLPLGVVTGAISMAAAGLAYAVKVLYSDLRTERRAHAKTARRARYAYERLDGVPSTPPPSDDEWPDGEDSKVIRAQGIVDRRWLDNKLQRFAADEDTPVSAPPPPRRPLKSRPR